MVMRILTVMIIIMTFLITIFITIVITMLIRFATIRKSCTLPSAVQQAGSAAVGGGGRKVKEEEEEDVERFLHLHHRRNYHHHFHCHQFIVIIFIVINGITIMTVTITEQGRGGRCGNHDHQCTMRTLYSIFSSQPNEVGHDFTLHNCDIIQHIFFPTRSVARKTLL